MKLKKGTAFPFFKYTVNGSVRMQSISRYKKKFYLV